MSNFHRIVACCFVGLSVGAGAQTVTSRVDILWGQPQRLQLVPDVYLRPGMTVQIVASESVDVNHEYGENRRCNWFGINCWYEQWDRANIVPASGLEIQFVPDEGTSSKTGSITYEVTIPLTSGNANFTKRVPLSAMLWLPGGASPARGPCIGRPRYCSQGALVVTFNGQTADVGARVGALSSILASQDVTKTDARALISADYMDEFLTDAKLAKASTIAEVSAKLAATATRWREEAKKVPIASAGSLHLKVIDLASYALQLSQVSPTNAASLRSLITESYIDRGDYAAAGDNAPKELSAAQSSYAASSTAETAKAYSRALKNSASVWREKSQKNSSAEIRVSIAFLDKATEILWPYSQDDGVSLAIADVNLDASRMLNLLRTAPDLKDAEARLVTAICFQMHGEQGKGKSFEAWRASVNDAVVDNCAKVVKPAA